MGWCRLGKRNKKGTGSDYFKKIIQSVLWIQSKMKIGKGNSGHDSNLLFGENCKTHVYPVKI